MNFCEILPEDGEDVDGGDSSKSIQLSASFVRNIINDPRATTTRRTSLPVQQKSSYLSSKLSLFSSAAAPRSNSLFINNYSFQQYLVLPQHLIPVILLLSQNLPTKTGANMPSSASLMTTFYLDNENFDAYHFLLGSMDPNRTYGSSITLSANNFQSDSIKVSLSSYYRENQIISDEFHINVQDLPQMLRGQPIHVTPLSSVSTCSQIQTFLRQKSYSPHIKVTYTQIEFQSVQHDHIRIVLKFNHNLYHITTAPNYYDWVHDPSRYNSQDTLSFPWGILEIRLKEPFISTPPAFIEKLVQSEYIFQPYLGINDQQQLFSIYSYGIYSFLYLSNYCPPELTKNTQGNQLVVRPIWWNELNALQGIESRIITKPLPSHWFTALIHSIFHFSGEFNSKYVTKEQKMSFQKIYFSCERTFLSWLGSASSAVTLGAFVATQSGGHLIGGLMILSGIFIVVYAITTYVLRVMKIESQDSKDKIEIYDLYGPVGLCLLVISTWIISWLLIIKVI